MEDLAVVFERVIAADDAAGRFSALTTGLEKAGFDMINYGYFDPAAAQRENAEVIFQSTMGSSWLEYYMDRGLHFTDPHVVKVREGNLAPYLWAQQQVAAVEDPGVRGTAVEIEEAGLVASLCVPLAARHMPSLPVAGLTLGSSLPERELEDRIGECGAMLVSLAHLYHNLTITDLWRERLGIRSLTPRERDCLRHLAAGLRQEAIADKLGISRVTVEFHLRNARRALKASTLPQAIARAVAVGEIPAF